MLMAIARKLKSLPDPFSHFATFADISQLEFLPITETLRAQHVKYSWGHPKKLLVTYQNKIVPIMTPKDGLKYLSQWGYQAMYPPSNMKKHSAQHLSKDWETGNSPLLIPIHHEQLVKSVYSHYVNPLTEERKMVHTSLSRVITYTPRMLNLLGRFHIVPRQVNIARFSNSILFY